MTVGLAAQRHETVVFDLLGETELVKEVANTSPRRYRVGKSDAVQELFELNSALNAAGE